MGRTKDRIGPLGCYWFLTFEHSSELRLLASECQAAIKVPGFDFAPLSSLHLTLDRIAYPGECTPGELNAIARAAAQACRDVPTFGVAVHRLGNMHGALAFDVSPAAPVEQLRGALRGATLSAYPGARIKETASNPHVTIAYPESGGAAVADADAVVDRINVTMCQTDIAITDVAMVALERLEGSYAWKVLTRISLAC
ncbi:2'-5' RNA ligase family protein [Nocardia sp. NPDC004573]